eukprot:TRINITY_DN4353_c0_g1_i1.p1 TRINITY_DN4353_c0_g1~~TRINITY_DN4353_c0_g1_i1.p1  ORF type:complete len:169 (-),score=29.25 TRINITY_DN4353_c0_g1_i1:59-565(-)
MSKDADDKSLQDYKKKLLASAETAELIEPDNPASVLVRKFSVVVEGEEKFSFDYPFDGIKFTLKEGSNYSLRLQFFVQREIVSGLKYVNLVYKMKMRVDKSDEMVGSYPPSNEIFTYTSLEDEAPKGLLARGSYAAKVRLLDDDEAIHLEFGYDFDIRRSWGLERPHM